MLWGAENWCLPNTGALTVVQYVQGKTGHYHNDYFPGQNLATSNAIRNVIWM